jgi:hypothetical protein
VWVGIQFGKIGHSQLTTHDTVFVTFVFTPRKMIGIIDQMCKVGQFVSIAQGIRVAVEINTRNAPFRK